MELLITTPQAEWFSRISISKRSAVSYQLSAKAKTYHIWSITIDLPDNITNYFNA
jgi:hypothetical protein